MTPESFVLDGSGAVRYHGRIDDGYASRTKRNNQAKSQDLENALEAVLDGKPVQVAETKALGCAIPRPQVTAATGKVTYHRDVEPILQ